MAGALCVELQTEDGRPIPTLRLADCVPLYGDKIDFVVKWRGKPNLAALAGEPIRIKFVMQECDVYSFQFR